MQSIPAKLVAARMPRATRRPTPLGYPADGVCARAWRRRGGWYQYAIRNKNERVQSKKVLRWEITLANFRLQVWALTLFMTMAREGKQLLTQEWNEKKKM